MLYKLVKQNTLLNYIAKMLKNIATENFKLDE